MQEYVVTLRRGADLKIISPTGSLTDAVRDTHVHVMESMPTGQSVVVAVMNETELSLLQRTFGGTCHVVQRAKGHVLAT